MNSLVNGCTSPPCAATYEMQGVVGIEAGSAFGYPAGWYVHDAHIELWWSFTANKSICSIAPPQFVNINQTGYTVQESISIQPNSYYSLTLTLSVFNSAGQLAYSLPASCHLPTSPSGATVVSYFTRTEGAVVGSGSAGRYMNFRPLNTKLFSAEIDLFSNQNFMGGYSANTQTGEKSNAYQDVSNTGTCGPLCPPYSVFYVQSNENTTSNTGMYNVWFAVSPVGAGDTDPYEGGWTLYSPGQIASISAYDNNGFAFTNWTVVNIGSVTSSSITFSCSTCASTTATIGGGGNVTATFSVVHGGHGGCGLHVYCE